MITFVLAKMIFKDAVFTFLVAKITSVVGEAAFKVAVITFQ